MNSKLLAISVGTLLCAVLSACNDGASVAKSQLATAPHGPGTPPSTGGGTNPVGTPPSPTPSPQPVAIDTFAKSLETFDFAFTKATRKVSVSFARLAVEAPDSAGMPTV